MNSIIIIILITLVFLLTVVGSYNCGKCYSEISLLNGFYEASSDFCDESHIQSFTFYIGNYCNGSYKTYLLMIGNEDEKIIINSPCIMTISNKKYNFYNNDNYEFNAYFSDLDSDFIPNNLKLKFYPRSGKIILSGYDNTIYGCLFKNSILTEIDIIKSSKSIVSYETDNTISYETDDIE
jgi:hypothetical protein